MNQKIPQAHRSDQRPIRYVFYGLGLMIPALISLYQPFYWFYPLQTGKAFRAGVLLISLVLALLGGQMRPSQAEIKLVKVLTAVCVLFLCSALAATDISRALEGWTKLLALCLLALLLSRALRNPKTAEVFGPGLIIASILIAAFIVAFYIRLKGWTLPSLSPDGKYKALAGRVGLSLNPVAFTSIMAFLASLSLSGWSRLYWVVGPILLFICTVFTASRTPLAVCFLVGLVMLAFDGIRSRALTLRFLTFTAVAMILIGSVLALQTASFKQMSDLTSGRWDIWYVAFQKFSERPLLGFGFGSVEDDLYSRLPGVFPYIPKYHDGSFPGGYHSQYMGSLAEEGLVGFAAVCALYWFLLSSCWQLAFRQWATWHCGKWALFGGLFLFIRGSDEVAGLFGYANGLGDFLAYIFLAIVVSRFSIEEDYAGVVSRNLNRQSQSELVEPFAAGQEHYENVRD